MTSDSPGEKPEPTTDPAPATGPGGVDSVPDWEDAGPDAVVPDPPRAAQVDGARMPDEFDESDSAEPDSAGAGEDSPGGTEEPAD